jgi:putative phosphoribosyl transferase
MQTIFCFLQLKNCTLAPLSPACFISGRFFMDSLFGQTENSIFADRRDAGRQLAHSLVAEVFPIGIPHNAIVLALPRGGVPVGFEVAARLKAPLDVFLVRKLGVPWHEELAMGAIASGGITVLDEAMAASLNVTREQIQEVARREEQELERRANLFRGNAPSPQLDGRTIILVDDGLATGSTMKAAVKATRAQNPDRLIVAVPVAPPGVCEEFRNLADDVLCLAQPESFTSVGSWYADFTQTSDDEVRQLLSTANGNIRSAA